MSKSDPIGVFDSGIGGLTVANAIAQYLPKEHLVYFGDTAHLPYGDKAPSSIIEYSKAIGQFLIEKKCKVIVIACNTASAIAYDHVVEMAGDIPVINVIDPVVQVVAANPGSKRVGVIGTRATILSGEYEKRLKKHNSSLEVCSMATPLLVPLIEEHIMDDTVGQMVISRYLNQPVLKDIDSLILGCTHYPLVKHSVEAFYKGQVLVYDSADIVGKYVKDYLEKNNMLSEAFDEEHDFYVSDFTESFEMNTRNFFGSEIHLKQISFW
ncbi:MAG: glutamate racemase [Vicingaceae bacterium]